MSGLHAALDWQRTTELGETVYTATAPDGRVFRIESTPIGYVNLSVDEMMPDHESGGLFESFDAAAHWAESQVPA